MLFNAKNKTLNIFGFLIGFTCINLIVILQKSELKSIQSNRKKDDLLKIEAARKTHLDLLSKFPSFGYSNLIADWSMLQFLQYFGDGKVRKETGYNLSSKYLEVISKKDPLFVRAYLIISPASSLFGGTPEVTIELMNEGLKYLTPEIPNSHFVWLYKGMDEILFFGNLEEAKKSYRNAQKWAIINGDEKIAQAALDTIKFLDSTPNTLQAQISVWFMLWTNNKDEATRKIAKENIEKLGGEIKIHPDGRVEGIPPKINKS